MKIRDLVLCALFTAVMAVCAWIAIPGPVPFTLQTLGVFLTVGLLGGKKGSIAVGAYILLGAVGLPVFSNFTGGIGSLIGPTGGYILGFLLSALLMWALEKPLGKKKWGLPLSMVLGLLVCYVFGTAYYMLLCSLNTGAVTLWTALGWCVFPFIPFDLIKILLSWLLCNRLKPLLDKNSTKQRPC